MGVASGVELLFERAGGLPPVDMVADPQLSCNAFIVSQQLQQLPHGHYTDIISVAEYEPAANNPSNFWRTNWLDAGLRGYTI
jgi:hypothetical protein